LELSLRRERRRAVEEGVAPKTNFASLLLALSLMINYFFGSAKAGLSYGHEAKG